MDFHYLSSIILYYSLILPPPIPSIPSPLFRYPRYHQHHRWSLTARGDGIHGSPVIGCMVITQLEAQDQRHLQPHSFLVVLVVFGVFVPCSAPKAKELPH